MTDASGSTTWSYDERGRMTGEAKTIGGNTYTTAWEYNLADLPVSQTYPDSEVVTSSYAPQLTLDTLSGLEPYISNSAYDSAGRMVARGLGNGVTQTHIYHPWSTDGGRLAGISAGTVQNLGYTYDDGGNILSIVDAIAGPQTQSFGYDALNRLTSADATGGLDGLYAETYGYDGNTGNLAAKAGLTYTYGNSAHPHAVTGLSDGSTYTYDANGSMISRTRNGVTTTFTYNAENKLVQVQEGGNTIAQFSYDGDGNRVQSTINGVTTQFVGEYYEVSGTDVTKYYGGQTAMRVNGIISYLLADHLGSNALILDSSGNLVGETRYKAWGELRYTTGATSDYTYTGQYSNTSDFGWMYFRARWYDPILGRFNQVDTIVPGPGNPQDWDRYSYVRNNPIIYNDPSGHDVGCSAANPECKDSNGLTEQSKIAMRFSVINKITDNGWDLIPFITNARGVVRGLQILDWADSQPEFFNQQRMIQNWYNDCYGQCHYSDSMDITRIPSSIGGPVPETPVVDIYSEGMGEVADNVIQLMYQTILIKASTANVKVFARGGDKWHYGIETSNKLNIIHLGKHPEFGIHLAIGSIKPLQADLHIYLQKAFPFLRIWRPVQ
jgi:RHS repeat-associated protein